MNAYKCLVIGRRDVAVRYMIHFYCLAVEAGFYSDMVECRTLNPADQVRSRVGEKCDLDFFSFPITHACLLISKKYCTIVVLAKEVKLFLKAVFLNTR